MDRSVTSSSSQIRRMNQRKVIRVMMRLRSASRVEIAKAAGMSQATVSRIVDDLLGEAVMAEITPGAHGLGRGEGSSSPIGRPSTPLELNRRRRRFLAIHLGVSQTHFAALPIAVPHADEWPVEIATPASPQRWIRAVADEWSRSADAKIEAIVVSLPGVVDERQSRVLLSPNLRWTERADLPGMLRTLVPDAPVLFVQEIRALALGQLAAEPQSEDFLLVDFGSGVGAANVIGGKLFRGPLALCGEIGHTPVVGNARACGCGSTGCVETLVSRDGFVATARENGGPGTWGELAGEINASKRLPDWILPALDAAATTVAGALNLVGLNRVVLTGSVQEVPAIGAYLCEAVERGTMWARFGDVTCTVAPRRRMAGLVAAAVERVLLSDQVH